jgi:uncharacterized protein YecT (DUF1311 family)
LTNRFSVSGSALHLLWLLTLVAPGQAIAGEPDCSTAQAQIELTSCAIQSRDAADAALQRTYERVMEKIANRDGKTLLRRAQRAWIAYKDRECEFESSGSRGGSINSMQVAACQSALIHARIIELEHQLSCDETDPSCVP